MTHENLPQEYSLIDVTLLAERVEANKAELVRRYEQVLRENLFTNHIQLRPRDMERIAELEAEALISFLRNSYISAREHGMELCQAGLGSRSVFEMLQAQRLFFMANLHEDGGAQNITSLYRMRILEGFMAAREKVILSEQENIRTAFQIALNRINAEVQEAQAAAQKATELSYRKIILAQEEERRRISFELHDEAGQALVGIHMSLENLNSNLPVKSEVKEGLEKAIFWTDTAIQKIRAVAYRLRPPVLDLLGLDPAIKQLCIDFSEQTGLIIHYSGTETPILSNELAISIYRIVQEALTNIIKHANAKHAWVKLKTGRGMLTLSIQDDGRGFDPETIQTGIGLDGMRERSHLLNGKMQIESEQGKLTLMKFTFPMIARTQALEQPDTLDGS